MLQSMGSQRVSLDLVSKQQNRMSNSANKNFTRVYFLSNDVFCTQSPLSYGQKADWKPL